MKDMIRKTNLPMILAAVLAAIMILTVFMPYASATEKHAKRLEDFSDYYSVEELDMTGKDLINISMAEFARMYGTMSEELFGDSSGVLYVVIVILIAGFSIGTLIFSVCKKPIGAIVFNILATLVFLVQNFDYKDRGIIPSDNYNWGIAYYIFIVCAVAVLAFAVVGIVMKILSKRNAPEAQ